MRALLNNLSKGWRGIGEKLQLRWAALKLADSEMRSDFDIVGIIGFSGFLLLLMSIILFSIQTFFWLKNGTWPEITLGVICEYVAKKSCLGDWLLYPNSWFGLHKAIFYILYDVQAVVVSLTLAAFLMLVIPNDF